MEPTESLSVAHRSGRLSRSAGASPNVSPVRIDNASPAFVKEVMSKAKVLDDDWIKAATAKGVDGDAVMAVAHGVRTIEVIRQVAPHLDADAEAAAIENHIV